MNTEHNEYNDVEKIRTEIAVVPDGMTICVWQGTILKDSDIPEFEKWFTETYGVSECHFLESILTLPTTENGEDVPNTGGRHDVIFGVRIPAQSSFPLQRIQTPDIKWLDDMVDPVNNPEDIIYPKYILKYVS